MREPSPSDVCWPGHPGGRGAGRNGGQPPGRDPPASARCGAKAGVPPDPFNQEGGESAGQLLVDGRRCGQLQVGRVHTGQGEDLAEEGEEVSMLGTRVTFQPEASRGQGREEALEADSKPVGQVKGRAATSSQVAAGLLGQHGLGPSLRAGEAKATS